MDLLKLRWVHKNLQTLEEWDKVLTYLRSKKAIGFDLETDGLEWWNKDDHICGIGVGCVTATEVQTWYAPIRHLSMKLKPLRDNLPFDKALTMLIPLAADKKVKKIGANIKFDIHWLEKYDVSVHNADDIQILTRILRTDLSRQKLGLKTTVPKEFGVEHEENIELKKWWRSKKIKHGEKSIEKYAYSRGPSELVGLYCGSDVRWTMLLAIKFFRELHQDRRLLRLYTDIEQPLLETVIYMERNGVRINLERLEALGVSLRSQAAELESQIYEEAGCRFDIASVAQVKEVVIPMGVKPEMRRRKQADGSRVMTESLDAKVFESYEGKVPIVDLILAYRRKTKILSTYVDNIIGKSYGTEDGTWIHADLRQEAAKTGRLSCSAPNLNNLPRS